MWIVNNKANFDTKDQEKFNTLSPQQKKRVWELAIYILKETTNFYSNAKEEDKKYAYSLALEKILENPNMYIAELRTLLQTENPNPELSTTNTDI